MASQLIYQFYSELAGFEPKIWRRFQVAGNITLARLCYIVMTLYEMNAGHLFSVDIPVDEKAQRISHYEVFSDEDDLDIQQDDTLDAAETKLSSLSHEPGLLLYFMYDFGDGWEVTLQLESVISDKNLPGKELPRVLQGEGFGIIEDCGGPDGLTHLAKVFQKKAGQEYESLSEWLGQKELDLAAFDLDDMNFRLKKVPRIYRDLYEYDYEPTDYSIGILNRDYLNK